MWPFKKKHDVVSKRLLGHDCDISTIYSRLSQHERFMNYELLDLVHKLDNSISNLVQEMTKLKLENNLLKQQLLKEKGRVVLTICNSSLHQ